MFYHLAATRPPAISNLYGIHSGRQERNVLRLCLFTRRNFDPAFQKSLPLQVDDPELVFAGLLALEEKVELPFADVVAKVTPA